MSLKIPTPHVFPFCLFKKPRYICIPWVVVVVVVGASVVVVGGSVVVVSASVVVVGASVVFVVVVGVVVSVNEN